MTGKKRCIIALVLFLAVALLLLFVSDQIYNMLLPRVTVEEEKPASITKTFRRQAHCYYDVKEDIVVPFDCTIKEILIEKGDDFSEGSPLFEIEYSELIRSLYQNRIALDTLKKQRGSFSKGSDSYELLSIQIEETEERIAIMEELEEQKGIIRSTKSGVVTDVWEAEGKYLEAKTPVLTVAPEGSALYLKWTMPESAGSLFSAYIGEEEPGSEFDADLIITKVLPDGTLQDEIERTRLSVSSIIYDKQNQVYQFESSLRGIENLAMEDGQHANVILIYTSREYSCTIPISAVTFVDGDDRKGSVFVLAERQKIFGTEFYVKSTVFDIVEYNNTTVAVSGVIGMNGKVKVVSYSNRALSGGDAVKIDGGR